MPTDAEQMTLAEAQERNLLTMWRRTLHIQSDEKTSFLIQNPTVVCSPFTIVEFQELETLLREKRLPYTTRHTPPGYYKDQGNRWLIELELDCSHRQGTASLTLVEFGGSYGTIKINGIDVAISHSGGTGKEPGTWTDFTTGWNLAGLARSAVVRSLIESMER